MPLQKPESRKRRLKPPVKPPPPVMDTPSTAKNWRLNAAAVIMDADGYVLLGKDNGRNPYWHFPQGRH